MSRSGFAGAIAAVWLAVIGITAPALADDDPQLKDGDIIFQRCQSRQAAAIAAATESNYTHVGLVFFENQQAWVYEAVQPVKRTPLDQWIARGEHGHFVIKRLKDDSDLDRTALKKETMSFLGLNYDLWFGWCDERIYCSELVWKAYQRSSGIELSALRRLGDFNLRHRDVQPILRERYGSQPPLDMQVVAPSDIFDSPLLQHVTEGGETRARKVK